MKYLRLIKLLLIVVIFILMVYLTLKSNRPNTVLSLQEFALTNTEAKEGLNRRMFNRISHKTDDIDVNLENGTFTLPAGTYLINSLSTIVKQTDSDNPSSPGYSILMNASNTENILDGMLLIGSVVDSTLNIPSVINDIIILKEQTTLALEHQCKMNDGYKLYTGLHAPHNSGGSTNYIFASITVLKL